MTTPEMRVLLVEDNPTDAHLVHAFLQRPESEFVARRDAGTLAAALEILRTERDDFDVVLLDLMLPDARELEALDAVRAEAPRMPIVVITVTDEKELGQRAVQRGAQDYLVKAHISPEVLFRSLRYALERHRRKAAEEALLRAQKMEAIGQLAGGVAHEFNNLLHTIRGTAELVMADLPQDDALRRDLEDIERATDRAAGLTRQLLAFSRKQRLRPEVVDLNDVVRELDERLRSATGEDVELVTRLEPELGRVRVDRGAMEQVVTNLALNARDAMPEGGTLSITTANTEADDPGGAGARRFVELAVADTGVGMDEAIRTRIFEPFFTTRSPGSGTGLGLAVVHGIVQASGGSISVTSEPGLGTTVAVRLPRVDETPEEVREIAAPETLPATILIVEDEHAVRKVASRILRRDGYKVLEAAGPGEATATARSFDGTIHLLLTDVVMPGGSGPSLAETLLRSRPDMKVMFMSGYTRELLPMDPTDAQEVVLLEKPFEAADLVETVRRVLGEQDRSLLDR